MNRKNWITGALLLFGALLPLAPHASAQQAERYTISGSVQQDGGLTLAGAQILIRGTSQGGITDGQGRYSIPAALPPGRYVVEATFIGRQTATREITLGSDRTVTVPTIVLPETVLQMAELVVTGPGAATERRALGNAVATVSGASINNAPAAGSIGVALQGKINGALISIGNGQPGSPITIRLRGNNSILGTAEPLVVLDGVIIDNTTDALIGLSTNATRGGAGMSSRLSDISPDDIDRVEVLKGAAAAALYGSRAKNGVLQIFTKRGQLGATRLSWGTEMEFSKVPHTLELNMAPTATAADVAIANAAGVRGPDGVSALKIGDPVTRYDTQDLIFRSGSGINSQMSVSGGSGSTVYFLSGAYRNEESIMRGADGQRYTVRAKLIQQIGNRFEVGGNGSYTKSHVDFVPEGEQGNGVLTSAVFTPTIWDARFNANLGRFPYNPVLTINPLDVIANWEAPEDVTRFFGNADVTFRALENLQIKYLFGIDDYRQESKFLRPPFSESAAFPGSVQNPIRLQTSTNQDLTVNHDARFGERFRLASLGGYRYTSQLTDIIRAAGDNLSPGQTLVGGGTQTASQSISELRTSSFFVQEQLAFDNRLFVTGGMNYEASSAFGEDQRWQLFPRLGASYVVLQDGNSLLNGKISSLRLRAAYGETGGQPPSVYDRFANYTVTSYAGRAGLVPSAIASNPDLKPERQKEIEGGFELGVLGDRAVLDLTAYDQKTTDLVLVVPLSTTTGFASQRQNVGEVTNRGIEIGLNTINLSNDNFTWRSRVGFAANRNKVTKLVTPNDTTIVGYLNAVIRNQPIGVFYGGQYARKADGSVFYVDTANANYPGRRLLLPARMTDTLFSATGVRTTPFVQGIIGDPNPDWTGSLSNSFSVGDNFEISALLDGRFGNDVANFTRRITEFFGSDKVLEKEANGDTIPMTYGRNPLGRINIYEEYIEDGSFIKLREVSATYRVKHPFVQRFGASSMAVTLSGRNLHTWTDYRGLDPELNLFSANTVAQGVDFSNTPLARTFVFGVNFVF